MVMIQKDLTTELSNQTDKGYFKGCIPWSAVIAGTILSISLAALLNILGVGLGLVTFDPDDFSALEFGHGTVIWLSLSGIIAMAIGGWIAGKFSYTICKFRRGCYGVMAWAIALLFTTVITSGASGAFIGGVINLAKGPVTMVARDTIEHPVAAANIANEAYSATSKEEKEEVKQKIQNSAKSLGRASIVIFFAFLLSAFAGIWGATFAKPFGYDNESLGPREDRDRKA